MNRYEYNVVLVGGRNAKEMSEALSSLLESTAKDGWEPIGFMPAGVRPHKKEKSSGIGSALNDFVFETTVQQVTFRRLT